MQKRKPEQAHKGWKSAARKKHENSRATTRVELLNRDPEPCPEALSCPFCGGEPKIQYWHGGKLTKRVIACVRIDCDVNPMVTGETKGEALVRWNRRDGQIERQQMALVAIRASTTIGSRSHKLANEGLGFEE